ncbi:MAG TPA: tetratricopeptide repeat protein, partial [Thermoanaerobaculia bacterium]|nr:tetratricopeptide repeat protein [Thermoanaerobaculia bacterium]
MPRSRFVSSLILLTAVAVYGWTVGFDFVFDDHVQIERNPWLRDPAGARLFFTEPFWGFYKDRGAGPSNYYRPLFGIFNLLLAKAFGIWPAVFHAASVALHAGVSLLVAAGARRLVRGEGRDAAALAAGLLFAVHPSHAEAVAWAAGQADLLAALFTLLTLRSYLLVKDGSAGRWAGWSGPLAYLCACLCKEPGVGALLVLFLVEAGEWRREGTLGAALRKAALRLSPYVLALGVYLALRLNALNGFAPRDYKVTSSLADALVFAAGLLARYLAFLVYPFPTRVLALVPAPSLLSPYAIAGIAVVGIALAGLAWAAWTGRARREILLPLAVMIVFVLPVLLADRIGGAHFSERYLYLPSVGFAWMAGLIWARVPPARRAPRGAALAVIVLFAAAAVARSAVYRSDLTLFQEALKTAPKSEIVRNNLGMGLYKEGRLEEAEREYREALRLNPRSLPPLANLALVQERLGDLAGARATFEEVLRRSPSHSVAA